MRTRRYILVAIALFCLLPSVALADGISPVLNLFHKDTWLPATLVTILIILIESVLLRRRIKEIRYLDTLWRCAVLNLVSSIAGSVILLGLGRDSFFLWDGMSLVLPLFFITLVTEIPMLRLLYRNLPLNWERACALGFRINIASYAVVFVTEIGLAIGFLSLTGHYDEKERSEWVHPELLTQSVGQIYATETIGGTHRLKVMDTKGKGWQSLTNCPAVDPNKWDVEGHTCAFVPWSTESSGSEKVVIASLPDFAPTHEISTSELADNNYDRNSPNWQCIKDISLSPDEKKLAVLWRVTDTVAYRDNSSYYNLGDKCVLSIFALDSGKQLIRASRWASDSGLCWFPDSSAVLFTSFKDENVYKITKAEVRGRTSYGMAYVKGDRYDRGLFSFNITSGEIRWFATGEQPTLSVGSRQFAARDESKALIIDTQGASRACDGISRLNYKRVVLSPCGKLMLAQIPRHQPLYPGARLTIIDIAQPNVRHIITTDLVYRFKWTTTNEELRTKNSVTIP